LDRRGGFGLALSAGLGGLAGVLVGFGLHVAALDVTSGHGGLGLGLALGTGLGGLASILVGFGLDVTGLDFASGHGGLGFGLDIGARGRRRGGVSGESALGEQGSGGQSRQNELHLHQCSPGWDSGKGAFWGAKPLETTSPHPRISPRGPYVWRIAK